MVIGAGIQACTFSLIEEESTIPRKNSYRSQNVVPIKPDKVSKDLVNEKIPFQSVMVIGSNGEALGIMNRKEALRRSEEEGLDLLVVAPKAVPPVCKILDYGKYHFEKQKKERQQSRSQRIAQRDAKEIKFGFNISDHDLETRANKTKKYLEDGLKVKVGVFLKGRQITKNDIYDALLNKFLDMIKDYGTAEKKPVQEGRMYSCLVLPLQKKEKE